MPTYWLWSSQTGSVSLGRWVILIERALERESFEWAAMQQLRQLDRVFIEGPACKKPCEWRKQHCVRMVFRSPCGCHFWVNLCTFCIGSQGSVSMSPVSGSETLWDPCFQSAGGSSLLPGQWGELHPTCALLLMVSHRQAWVTLFPSCPLRQVAKIWFVEHTNEWNSLEWEPILNTTTTLGQLPWTSQVTIWRCYEGQTL